jgi:hypothetical protein
LDLFFSLLDNLVVLTVPVMDGDFGYDELKTLQDHLDLAGGEAFPGDVHPEAAQSAVVDPER